ncbi:MAG: glycosyltransferase family 4 protein [Actinomycetota bacterium]|nr:glycosyltransferase family 4 protein [Actinomycetota bacterium]
MRVLTVGNRYPPHGTGGYERVWQAAVTGLAAAGHEVTVLTTDHRDPGTAPDAAEPGVHRALRWYWRDHAFLPLGLAATRGLERHNARVFAAHERRADLVIWFSMGGMGLSLTGRTAAPQLAVVHDGWPTYGPRVDRWTSRWGRFAAHRYDPARIDWWSFNSAYSRDLLVRAGVGIDPARTSVEPPGIDPARFPAAEAPPWRGELLVLGRVEERKGVADAIVALPGGMRLTVAGPADPAHLLDLQGLAAGRAVAFTGPTDDPARALAAADAVLFPVRWAEPWGLVPLEAMAVGRPVVATGTGGSAEYLRDGENCLLVAPDDPPALRSAAERLRDEPALRAHLIAGGRQTAARFTETAWVWRVVALAERVAGG